jgi:hypothetical protein
MRRKLGQRKHLLHKERIYRHEERKVPSSASVTLKDSPSSGMHRSGVFSCV